MQWQRGRTCQFTITQPYHGNSDRRVLAYLSVAITELYTVVRADMPLNSPSWNPPICHVREPYTVDVLTCMSTRHHQVYRFANPVWYTIQNVKYLFIRRHGTYRSATTERGFSHTFSFTNTEPTDLPPRNLPICYHGTI